MLYRNTIYFIFFNILILCLATIINLFFFCSIFCCVFLSILYIQNYGFCEYSILFSILMNFLFFLLIPFLLPSLPSGIGPKYVYSYYVFLMWWPFQGGPLFVTSDLYFLFFFFIFFILFWFILIPTTKLYICLSTALCPPL